MTSLLSRYRSWRGERLKLRAEIAWLLDEALDCVPAYSWRERKWYLRGQWGCQLRLWCYWVQERIQERRMPEVTCPKCRGKEPQKSECMECNGTGKVWIDTGSGARMRWLIFVVAAIALTIILSAILPHGHHH